MNMDPQSGRTARTGRHARIDAGEWILDNALQQSDVASIAEWLAAPRIAYVLGRRPAEPNAQQALAYVRTFDMVASHLFIARRRTEGVAEGMVAIRMDGRHLIADIDIIVGARTTRDRDGQDLLLAAGLAATRWVFQDVGMQKVMVRVLERNRRTATWARAHLTLEGTLRGHARLPDGGRHTVLQFGLLLEEWRERYDAHTPDQQRQALDEGGKSS